MRTRCPQSLPRSANRARLVGWPRFTPPSQGHDRRIGGEPPLSQPRFRDTKPRVAEHEGRLRAVAQSARSLARPRDEEGERASVQVGQDRLRRSDPVQGGGDAARDRLDENEGDIREKEEIL